MKFCNHSIKSLALEPLRINVSLIDINKDFYDGVYGDTLLNWSMFSMYILGLVCCIGMGLISWFEKSGQAGPYRTVLNQLLSIGIDLGIAMYIFDGGLDNLRLVVGPLPSFICHLGFFVRFFIAMFTLFLIVGYSYLQFFLLVIRKSMPAMDDNFIAIAVVSNAFLMGLLSTLSKAMLDGSSALSDQMCTGEWKIGQHEINGHPIGALIAVVGLSMSFFLTIIIWIKERRKTIISPMAINHQQSDSSTKLDRKVSFVVGYVMAFFGVFLRFMIQRTADEDLNIWPNMLLIHASNTILPFLSVSLYCLIQYSSNRHMRKVIKRLFIADQMIHIDVE